MNRAARVDLSDRRMIVTGASPGSLGFATARMLAEWGARVVVTTRSRTDEVVRQLAGPSRDVVGRELDLAEATSVQRFVDWYVQHEGDAVDVLVNNAGVHLDLRARWKEPRRTPDGYEIHWRTNYLGTMHLTHLLLPLLSRTGDARVVTVVSKLHVRGRNRFLFSPLEPYHSWDAYGLSKLALVHAMNQLAARYADKGIRACSLHPGSVRTHIADRGLEGHRVISALRRVLGPVEARILLSPEDGAQTTLHCATAPDVASGYYRDCMPALPGDEVTDSAAATRLWEATSAWVTALRRDEFR